MVTSDMQRAADLPSRCCLFNNCVQFTTFYMERFTTVLRKIQTSIFLLLVIVMDSIKSNVSVYFQRFKLRPFWSPWRVEIKFGD